MLDDRKPRERVNQSTVSDSVNPGAGVGEHTAATVYF